MMPKLLLMSLMLLLNPLYVSAQVNLPPVNLGGASFMDGLGGPGTLIQESLSYYSAEKFMDSRGDKLATENSHIQTLATTTMIAHLFEYKIMGGFYGVEALLPVARIDIDLFDHNKKTGVADLVVSPFILQWNGIKIKNMPFHQRLSLNFNLPTGQYNANDKINVGSNALSFNPYYAFTLEPSAHVEVSMRLHYLWNGKNNSPNTSSGDKHTQAGQAFHLNYASSYQLSDHFRVGLAGYYLEQISEHKVNGESQENSKESVFSIGPGFQYSNKGITVNFNSYIESKSKNRPQGKRFSFRISTVL